ncbi:conserved hypothetical protein [Ricinus communis]|uniref:Uncharacterized protein n=1 Tax=Ricinus communis TaxID=3988 RepID=B9RKU5_RICCO|nr:conserved hypothetical protein [Ricinus communis]
MLNLLYRETELVSEGDHRIEIKESRRYAPAGNYDRVIEIPISGHLNIPATYFHDRSILSGRATVLKIFINGDDSGEVLNPQHFVHFSRLIFSVEPDTGCLVIRGVRARLTDFGRLRGLGWLLRRYSQGRQDERII